MSNAETVSNIYGAFGRGDIPAILDTLDDNVEWDVDTPAPGVPWLEPRRGKNNIPAFFATLAPLKFTSFEPRTIFESGNQVMALIHMEVEHTASGKRYSFPNEGHLWLFNTAGKVVKYQHITDTALHQRMANGT